MSTSCKNKKIRERLFATHLRQYPFDWLKIDRSLVCNVEVDANADAIVSAVIGPAHGMSRPVVAGGVKTVSQLDILRRRGCDVVQGHLISGPLPARRLQRFAQTWAGFDRDALRNRRILRAS